MAAFADLVIVIPGILGSRLVRHTRSGKKEVVWDFPVKTLHRVIRSIVGDELVLDPWAQPGEDGIEADDLFSYQLLPGFFGVDDYGALVQALRDAIARNGIEKRHPERQVITFPYDWRWSNRYAAEGLARRVHELLPAWRERSGASEAKVWLVAHSMGGLVARYYCEHLGGAGDVRGIVTMGTPHRGSVNALDAIANGKQLGPFNMSNLVRSLPSAYELLPLFPVLKITDERGPRLARLAEEFGFDKVTGASVASSPVTLPPALNAIKPNRLQAALEFHARIRQPAQRRADAGEPSPYAQRAIFNRRQPTAQCAELLPTGLGILRQYPQLLGDGSGWGESIPDAGDGTVPQRAAVPIEWRNTSEAIANAQKHTAIQATPEAIDTIVNWLMPDDVTEHRGAGTADNMVVALDCPDVLDEGEELIVTLSSGTPTYAEVDLINLESKAVLTKPATITDQPTSVGFDKPIEATYQIVVRPTLAGFPVVSDYTLILKP